MNVHQTLVASSYPIEVTFTANLMNVRLNDKAQPWVLIKRLQLDNVFNHTLNILEKK
jgi:hypothetical protein